MHWAKTRSRARFNLATSGLANLKLDELQVSLADLEITGESWLWLSAADRCARPPVSRLILLPL